MTSDEKGLRSALAAEHAAIYAYGRLGVLLDPEGKGEAQAAEAVHKARRDALVVRLDELKAAPEPAQAGYVLPFPVSDRDSALKLAVHVEDGVSATWRDAIAASEGEERKAALNAYMEAAVRATRWRRMAGLTPLTSAYPGKKG